MKKHYSLTRFSLVTAYGVILIAAMSSCGKKDPNSPGVEFFPDMYRSPSLEYYSVHTVDGDTIYNAKHPVSGTVARGFVPYNYPETPEGYEQAGLNLKSPLDMSKRVVWEQEGEVLYGNYCIHCHGSAGGGDGKVSAKLPGPPPAYDGALKSLPEGKIFHSITYGKNSMGAHASQLTSEERWKLVVYVQKLQGSKTGTADSTAVAVPVAVSK